MQTTNLDRRVVFVLLIIVMLAIAAGHLWVIGGFTELVLGLPLWLWLQLVVVAVLFVLAWIAAGVVRPNGGE